MDSNTDTERQLSLDFEATKKEKLIKINNLYLAHVNHHVISNYTASDDKIISQVIEHARSLNW